MEDIRHTAYAYYKACKEHLEEPVKLIFNEMKRDGDGKVWFEEFKSYMETVDCAQFGTKDFFDELCDGENKYLEYGDVVTLLYIIHSGRPFCEKCKRFVKGTYFTCVRCFEAESDYSFNVCPSCFNAGSYQHGHKEFMDTFLLLTRKKKQDPCKDSTLGHTKPTASNSGSSSSKTVKTKPSNSKTVLVALNPPSASNPVISSSQTAKTKPNTSKAIVPVPNPPRKTSSASNPGISSSQTAKTKPNSSKAIIPVPNPPRKTSSASNPRISSSQTVKTEPNSSKAIVPVTNPPHKTVKRDTVFQLAQLGVAIANIIVSSPLCTIM